MNERQGLTATVVVALAAMIAVAVAATLLAPLISGAIMTRADLLGAPCAQLPPTGEVRRIVAERQEVWTQVRQRSVTASLDTGRCPGKADIIIHYATADDRAAIKRLLGDTFFGIPYRMMNV